MTTRRTYCLSCPAEITGIPADRCCECRALLAQLESGAWANQSYVFFQGFPSDEAAFAFCDGMLRGAREVLQKFNVGFEVEVVTTKHPLYVAGPFSNHYVVVFK